MMVCTLSITNINNSYYSSTSYPHRPSHCRPRVRDDRRGAGGRPPPSETRRGGIRRAVVQSPAVTVTRHAQARPPPLGPRPGLDHRRPRPPPPPACVEPRPPRRVPPGLDLCPPHPHQEFRKPPCRPPLPLLPTAATTPTTSAALKPRGNHHRRTTSRGPPCPRCCRPCRPGRGGRGEGCRTQRPVAPGIAQPISQDLRMVVSLSLSSSSGARRGGIARGSGCRARRQRRKRQQRR
jgi:hypothetical protein